MQDRSGTKVARHALIGAWPVAYSVTERSGQAVGKIEIAVEKVERAK